MGMESENLVGNAKTALPTRIQVSKEMLWEWETDVSG